MLPTAQATVLPTLTWVTVTPDSTPLVVTATGTLLVVVEPLPSWPPPFRPQQYGAPVPPSAQV